MQGPSSRRHGRKLLEWQGWDFSVAPPFLSAALEMLVPGRWKSVLFEFALLLDDKPWSRARGGYRDQRRWAERLQV